MVGQVLHQLEVGAAADAHGVEGHGGAAQERATGGVADDPGHDQVGGHDPVVEGVADAAGAHDQQVGERVGDLGEQPHGVDVGWVPGPHEQAEVLVALTERAGAVVAAEPLVGVVAAFAEAGRVLG